MKRANHLNERRSRGWAAEGDTWRGGIARLAFALAYLVRQAAESVADKVLSSIEDDCARVVAVRR